MAFLSRSQAAAYFAREISDVRFLHYLAVRPGDLVDFDPGVCQRAPSPFAISWHVDKIQGCGCSKHRDTAAIGLRFISKCCKPVHIFCAMQDFRNRKPTSFEKAIYELSALADDHVDTLCDVLSQVGTTLRAKDQAMYMPPK